MIGEDNWEFPRKNKYTEIEVLNPCYDSNSTPQAEGLGVPAQVQELWEMDMMQNQMSDIRWEKMDIPKDKSKKALTSRSSGSPTDW